MARTKGITLRVRRPLTQPTLDDTLPDDHNAPSSSADVLPDPDPSPRIDDNHDQQHDHDAHPGQAEEDDADTKSHRSTRQPIPRSRSTRLARTRSTEQPFAPDQDLTPSRASPSRRSRRQSTRNDIEDVQMASVDAMEDGQVDPPASQDAASAPMTASPSAARSRRSRHSSRPSATPKTLTTPRKSTRTPRASTGRASRRSVAAEAEEQEDQEDSLPVVAATTAKAHSDVDADDNDGVAEHGTGEAEAGNEQDAEEEEEEEEDDNQDGDDDNDNEEAGDGDDDDEKGVDEEGHETVTIKGKVYRLESDGEEVILPSDPDGDGKIDEKGRLQGGRQYKAYHFTSDLRGDPEKVYMLAIDAARAAGYRDSLYFFRKNPMILKIELLQAEKDKLIEDGRLSGQLKNRNVTMVPARNVYKLHGARFLGGGKAVTDDYYEAEARASGVKEGKTVGGMSVEEQERRKEAERERERPKRKADTFSFTTIDPQGDPVVTTFGDAGQSPWIRAGQWQSRRAALQRADITEDNWMLEMARSVRGMNSELGETRRGRLSAFPRLSRFVGLYGVEPADEEPPAPVVEDGEADPADDPEALNDLPPWERAQLPPKTAAELDDAHRKRKAAEQAAIDARRRRGPPVGVYEPNTHLPHVNLLTQPTWAVVEKVAPRPFYVHHHREGRDSRRARTHAPILGGDRIGSGAWGVASFSLESLPPAPLPPYLTVPPPSPPPPSKSESEHATTTPAP
ncbi:hypothetical protein BCV70DRAFT_199478 [Testicularia cyperi]|uniref:Uncharacterized protein n=1 Tax=Testicularia cyperi TaxID=1882483 RepID=A0A317XT95_9BASI|nr:hypothetical protein BCV70DRAFT_199478 [Testicularia cyperi]